MSLLDQLAEGRIQEALQEGAFDDLPGAGKPLELDDDSFVPEHLRTAYRVLKNANCIPPELAQRQEIRSLEDLIEALAEDGREEAVAERSEAQRRLTVLRARLEASSGPGRSMHVAEAAYRDALLQRLHRGD